MPVLKPGDAGPQSWPCPVCGGDNTGMIQEGCAHCGAGTAQPFKKARSAGADPAEGWEAAPAEAGRMGPTPETPSAGMAWGAAPEATGPRGTHEEVFSTHQGSVRLSWPDTIQWAELDEVEAWVKIVLKKIRKRIARDTRTGA